MRLEPGTELLHYRLVDKLGEGGMGVVWRAADTTLDREVAIKVLPAEFADDPDRLARFEREAKLLASLNHANIAAIHGLHETRGLRFLAMELVRGETLAARLQRGSLDVEETLTVASQILEALEAAHARGVVHRDLKPANVQLTPEGKVKVLDFGLAKALESAAETSGADATRSPTLTFRSTQVGTILGTAAYMSPEQARGHVADARSDLWSFGVVLWEMLTGERLFLGETVSDTLAAVLRAEPDWERLPAGAPPALRRLLERCLTRDPAERQRHAGDARLEIRDATREGTGANAPTTVSARRVHVPWAIALALLLLAFVLTLSFGRREVHESPTVVFDVMPPKGLRYRTADGLSQISPDGRRLLVTLHTSLSSLPRLAVRRLDADGFTYLTSGESGPDAPFWSADGRSIGFFSWPDARLMRVDLDGGPPVLVTDAPEYMGADWSDDGWILYGVDTGPIVRVRSSGGTPEPVTSLDQTPGASAHWYPQLLPDGERFLFLASPALESEKPDLNLSLWVGDLRGGAPRRIDGSFEARVVYAPPGYLLFMRGDSLLARAFDERRLSWEGEARLLAKGVLVGPWATYSAFSVSRSGVLAYHLAGENPGTSLVTRNALGDSISTLTIALATRYLNLDLAPDGRRAAIEREDGDGNLDLWIVHLDRGFEQRFTSDPARDIGPVWSPDGTRIAFVRRGRETNRVLIKTLIGGSEEAVLHETDSRVEVVDWSPDGAWLLAEGVPSGSEAQGLLLLATDGGREPVTFADSPFQEHSGRFSPDGDWIAYVSAETGREEIYVRASFEAGASLPVSSSGGRAPRWNSDGSRIFFHAGDALMVASVRAAANSLQIGIPEVVFEPPTDSSDYEPLADGNFLFAEPFEGDPMPIRVVLNWPRLLDSRED